MQKPKLADKWIVLVTVTVLREPAVPAKLVPAGQRPGAHGTVAATREAVLAAMGFVMRGKMSITVLPIVIPAGEVRALIAAMECVMVEKPMTLVPQIALLLIIMLVMRPMFAQGFKGSG